MAVTYLPILFLFFLSSIIQAQSAGIHLGEDVLRINHGVHFKFVAHSDQISKIYRHSFVFELPTKNFHETLGLIRPNTSDSSAKISRADNWFMQCLTYWDNVLTYGNDTVVPKSSAIFDPRSLCMKRAEKIKPLIVNARKGHQEILEYIDELYNLLPIELTQSRRSSRGLFDFVGEATKWLFGTSTSGDTEVLRKQINQAVKVTKAQTEHVSKLAEDMMSYTKKSNARFEKNIDNLKANALHLTDMYEESRLMHTTLEFDLKMEEQSTKLHTSIESVKNHLHIFIRALKDLMSGSIPVDLITGKMLKEVISDTQAKESDPLLYKTPLEYYREGSFLYGYTNGHLIVLIEVPISDGLGGFYIYEVQALNLIVPNHDTAVTRINTNVKAIALSQDKSTFYEIKENDFCELSNTGIPKSIKHVYKKFNMQHCLLAIFQDDSNAIKAACKYTIIVDEFKSSIQWLTKSDYLLTNIPYYDLECQRNAPIVGGRRHGCVQCVIQVLAQCRITYNQYITKFEPGRLQDLNYTSSGMAIGPQYHMPRHFVNRPLLSHFFSEEDIAMIRGDSVFNIAPFLDLPEIKIKKPNFTIADNQIMTLDLEKSAEMVKQDGEILHKTADMIFTTSDNFQNLNSSWGGWFHYLTLILSGLSVLLIIHIVYLTVKIRSLTVLMTILQQNIILQPAKAASVVSDRIILQYKSSKEAEAVTEVLGSNRTNIDSFRNIHLTLSNSLGYYIYLIIIGLIVVIAIFCFKYFIGKCKKWITETSADSTLSLRVSSGRKNIIIPIIKIHALISDIDVICRKAPADLKVTGRCCPKLIYIWNAECVDRFFGKTIPVPQIVQLTFIQYFQLKRALNQKHAVTVVFVENTGTIVPITAVIPHRKTTSKSPKTQSRESLFKFATAPNNVEITPNVEIAEEHELDTYI